MGRDPRCQQGTLRHIAAITDRPVIRRLLRHRPPLTAACHQAPVPPVGTTSHGRSAGTHERPRGGTWDTWPFGYGSSVNGVDKTTCLIKRV